MGKIVEDIKNDIVFTPEVVSDLMCKLTGVNSESVVIDNAAGTGRLLSSALKFNAKKIIGIEYNKQVYDMLVSNFEKGLFFNQDGMADNDSINYEEIDVVLSNPPYSYPNKGLEFAHHAMSKMESGKCCVLIQESAGNGVGKETAREILKNNTLLASIHMSNIFCGKANVQVAIFLFDVGIPHDVNNIVKFIDMSNDGYKRTARKGSIPKNIDRAEERYQEVCDLVLKGKEYLNIYSVDEYIEDTITLDGNDWIFSSHKIIDVMPTEDDFIKTIDNYYAFKAKQQFVKIFGDRDPYFVAMHLLSDLKRE